MLVDDGRCGSGGRIARVGGGSRAELGGHGLDDRGHGAGDDDDAGAPGLEFERVVILIDAGEVGLQPGARDSAY